ncbi:MAG TPA: FAD-dependent monooxygenase [Pseudomonadales bacterium]
MEGGATVGRLTEVAVVGAGPAGSALAIACRQAGLAVRIYDHGSRTRRQDHLVELTANGTRVLHALGLKQDLAAVARFPAFATTRSARTAFLLTQRPLGAFSEARYGAPCCLIRGEDLRALLTAAVRRSDIPVESSAVSNIDTATGTLILADGRRVAHLAVAVASGRPADPATPDLAALVAPRSWSVPERPTLIRARTFRERPDREHDRFLNTWLGDGFLVLERPDAAHEAAGQPVELFLVSPARRPERTASEAIRSLLRGCHPHLARLAENLEADYEDVPVAEVAEHWQTGRVALLGGAAHAAPAYPELEPSAALEDAWILSRMMERWEEAPHQGFAEYERFRRSRAKRLRAFAGEELSTNTVPQGLARWQRNLRWSLSGRFLPEIAMQRLDWLYGYDCIRGFA